MKKHSPKISKYYIEIRIAFISDTCLHAPSPHISTILCRARRDLGPEQREDFVDKKQEEEEGEVLLLLVSTPPTTLVHKWSTSSLLSFIHSFIHSFIRSFGRCVVVACYSLCTHLSLTMYSPVTHYVLTCHSLIELEQLEKSYIRATKSAQFQKSSALRWIGRQSIRLESQLLEMHR